MSECPHGHLARSCEICERDQRIAELEGRLGSIEKFDEASGLCCVKGCTELSVWCCPPLCEHHTALLEPVVEKVDPDSVLGRMLGTECHVCHTPRLHNGMYMHKPGCSESVVEKPSPGSDDGLMRDAQGNVFGRFVK